jgi:putative sterol carrier protein
MARVPDAFVPEKAGTVNAVIHFKFTGAESGEWNASIRDGKCEVAQGIPHQRPTITLTADSADFLKIASGELDPATAFMEGKIKLQGDAELALRLLPMFRMGQV